MAGGHSAETQRYDGHKAVMSQIAVKSFVKSRLTRGLGMGRAPSSAAAEGGWRAGSMLEPFIALLSPHRAYLVTNERREVRTATILAQGWVSGHQKRVQ